jgi:hypothetical protein
LAGCSNTTIATRHEYFFAQLGNADRTVSTYPIIGWDPNQEKGEAMTTRVMVTLQDDVYRHVERLAQLTSRDVADLLADTITLTLQPLAVSAESLPAITSLSDEEVLGLTELQMAPKQDRRLSMLLQKQQERALSAAEQTELVMLMQVYQQGVLRKAQALHEAVRRGLRTPLEP